MSLKNSQASKQWEKIGIRHHHGINVPVFSLHSEKSSGIGEYTDFLPLIDFCKDIGFDVIQTLPLNDTGHDTSPYNALSANALHPLFLGLHDLPLVERVPHYQERLNQLHELVKTPKVLYDKVTTLKELFLNDYCKNTYQEISQRPDYQEFIKKHHWLGPYALFKALKEKQNWIHWEDWPLKYKSPSEKQFAELFTENKERIDFHTYIQYHCFNQMKLVKETAEKAGIFIKGDIPILISRDSADVWYDRHYFLLHIVAGSPPDQYSAIGQDWGFPVYDWEELERNSYDWWKRRLEVASELYHIYRIDHIVGFFRLWTIPKGRLPKEGQFLPADETRWIPHGKKLMEMMLQSALILPIGEDLGTVPPDVRATMKELGIPGTKVMRWERKWKEDGSFIDVKDYAPESMTTVSTHDTDTLPLWWRHSAKEAKLYSECKGWTYKPFLTWEQNREILYDSHHSNSLFHINLLMEYLALFPDQISSNPQDERINVPGKVLSTNWSYRFRPSLEDLNDHTHLKTLMKNLK